MDKHWLNQDSTAISRLSSYKYQLESTYKDEEPIEIEIVEYIDLREKSKTSIIYNVYINGYNTLKDQKRERIPERFLYTCDLIDHYISSLLQRIHTL